MQFPLHSIESFKGNFRADIFIYYGPSEIVDFFNDLVILLQVTEVTDNNQIKYTTSVSISFIHPSFITLVLITNWLNIYIYNFEKKKKFFCFHSFDELIF